MRRWFSFFRQRQNVVAVLLVGLFIGTAVAAPTLAPQPDPANPLPFKSLSVGFDRQPHPPSAESPLGTSARIPTNMLPAGVTIADAVNQWDVWHTLVWGTRDALRFGLLVTLATAVFGVLVGLVSGYVGGFVNSVLMRITDAFLTFPPIAAIWLLQRLLFVRLNFFRWDPPPDLAPLQQFLFDAKLTPVMLTLIFFSWMPYARIINSLMVQRKQSDYVLAARSMGASHTRIIFRHLLPNVIAPAIVLAARDVGSMVVWETAFTYMGISGTLPWGIMLVANRDYIMGVAGNPFVYWWTFAPISLAIILFGMGWNLLGDGLNNWLNPRGRH